MVEPVVIRSPGNALEDAVTEELKRRLAVCPDVAFAYLAQVVVGDASTQGDLCLFVWLRADALSSVRSALNLVSEAVARALPPEAYVDVVILNSAPELLAEIQNSGELIVVVDAEEHQLALDATSSSSTAVIEEKPASPWWSWFFRSK